MIAVIFEVIPHPGRSGEYFERAANLKPLLEQIDGFISIERYESLASPGKFLSLSFWESEEGIIQWRQHAMHRESQQAGREDIFKDYRLRVAAVLRDYGMFDRSEVPA